MSGPYTQEELEAQLVKSRANGMLPRVQRKSRNEFAMDGAPSAPFFNPDLKAGTTAEFFDNRMTPEQFAWAVSSVNSAVVNSMVGQSKVFSPQVAQMRFVRMYNAAIDGVGDATTALRAKGCYVTISVNKGSASTFPAGGESFSLNFPTSLSIVFDDLVLHNEPKMHAASNSSFKEPPI